LFGPIDRHFVHSSGDAPFIMNSDCAIKTESTDREGAVEQGICVVDGGEGCAKWTVEEFTMTSLVVIAADHGYGFRSKFAADSDGISLICGRIQSRDAGQAA
jgi:hypothetical protein